MGDLHGESNGKRSLPSDAIDFSPRKNFEKGSSSSEEDSPQVRSLFEINNGFPPINYSENGRETHILPVVVGGGQVGFGGAEHFYDANPKVSNSIDP